MWWQEVKIAMALDLEVLWGWDGSTTGPLSHALGMDWDDVWSLYIVRRLDGFKENVNDFYKSDKEEPSDDWD